ncbi:DUF3747 domain-containing protein [Sodalinema gerasimenkoae]|uniref:DUF3747 domain-containing protein n=1 Tax=Sodalinema gerasimenkoae TaxID=2862348 RepID=UPI0013573FC8|nr:DUF3747 domain-containing protein [Sodalinema gerasimenkoae]
MQLIKQRILFGLAALGLGGTLVPEAIAHSHRQENNAPEVAARFEQAEVDSGQFIAIAAPVGRTNGYQLLVVEQRSNSRPCWEEQGSQPTLVDPLLLEFDFTGVCGRSTDSNGYSIRAGQQDLGLRYSLQVRQRNGELVLMGIPMGGDRSLPRLQLGRTRGPADGGFYRIHLDPGWRFTRRSYQGQGLGHIYLTHDLTLAQLADQPASPPSPSVQDPVPTAQPQTPAQGSVTLQESDASESSLETPNTIEFGDDPRTMPSGDDRSAPSTGLPSLTPEGANQESLIYDEVEDQPFAAPVLRQQFPNSPLPAFRDES